MADQVVCKEELFCLQVEGLFCRVPCLMLCFLKDKQRSGGDCRKYLQAHQSQECHCCVLCAMVTAQHRPWV